MESIADVQSMFNLGDKPLGLLASETSVLGLKHVPRQAFWPSVDTWEIVRNDDIIGDLPLGPIARRLGQHAPLRPR